jgi:hypothetical protein
VSNSETIDEEWDAPSGNDAQAPADDATRVGSPKSGRKDEWCVNVAEGDISQLSVAEIAMALRSGRINEQTLVWRDGMADWIPLSDVPALGLVATRAKNESQTPPPAAVTAAAVTPTSPPAKASNRPVPRPDLKRGPSERPKPASAKPSARPSASPSNGAPVKSSRSTLSPTASATSTPAPPAASNPASSQYSDEDDDENTTVMTGRALHMLRMSGKEPAKSKPAAAAPAAPPAPEIPPDAPPAPSVERAPILAVYERPVATLAFADSVEGMTPPPKTAAAPEPVAAPTPSRPSTTTPPQPTPRIPLPRTSSAPLHANPSADGEPKRMSVSPPPKPARTSTPARSAEVQSAPVAAPVEKPAPAPVASLPTVIAPTGPIPDSFTPVTAGADEDTDVRRFRRRPQRSNLTIVASVASAVIASLVTALVMRSSQKPTPLLVAPVSTPQAAAAPVMTTAPVATVAVPAVSAEAAASAAPASSAKPVAAAKPATAAADVAAEAAATAEPSAGTPKKKTITAKQWREHLAAKEAEKVVLEEEGSSADAPAKTQPSTASTSTSADSSTTPKESPGF